MSYESVIVFCVGAAKPIRTHIQNQRRPRDAARAQGRRRKVILVAIDSNGINVKL